jgi:hypothetical protein
MDGARSELEFQFTVPLLGTVRKETTGIRPPVGRPVQTHGDMEHYK